VLQSGLDGVLAVHSVSKRSNLAGVRVGFYAGDAELVSYLSELRKHAGFMVPGPAQAAAAAALSNDGHVDAQAERYRHRLESFRGVLREAYDLDAPMPGGGLYLWVEVGDAWAFAERMAVEAGCLVSPGDFYGPAAAHHVRIAMVQPDEKLALVAERLRSR